MATVQQVANASLKRIQVAGSEAPLEPDEYQDFIFTMNMWMAAIKANGIDLGYTPVSNIAEEVTVPDGALLGLTANMAVRVASDYGGIVTDTLVLEAKEGLRAMRMLGQKQPHAAFPPTLPTGSGNQDNGWMPAFYPGKRGDCGCDDDCDIPVQDGDQTYYVDCEDPIQ